MRRYKHNSVLSNTVLLFIVVVIAFFTLFTVFYEPHWSYNFHGINREVKDTILLMHGGYIPLKPVTGDPSKYVNRQWNRQEWLAHNATTEELKKLTSYPYGSVKVVAYRELINRDTSLQFKLLSEALTSQTYLYVTDGHAIFRNPIGRYLFDEVYCLHENAPLCPDPVALALDDLQIKRLQSMRNSLD